jgi:hypothetical protein
MARRYAEDSQINEFKHLLVSFIEKLETRLRRKDNQIDELMTRIAALERTLEKNPVIDRNSSKQRHHVKITPWRVLNTVLVVGLGAQKAVATYRRQET